VRADAVLTSDVPYGPFARILSTDAAPAFFLRIGPRSSTGCCEGELIKVSFSVAGSISEMASRSHEDYNYRQYCIHQQFNDIGNLEDDSQNAALSSGCASMVRERKDIRMFTVVRQLEGWFCIVSRDFACGHGARSVLRSVLASVITSPKSLPIHIDRVSGQPAPA
jgi:hypothetical protein